MIEDNGQYAAYTGVLNNRLDTDGKEYVYDITRTQKAPGTQVTDETVLDTQPELSEDNITASDDKSNSSESDSEVHSVQIDSDGRELSDAQQAYFKDSEVRDDDGRLLRVYHGTSEKFTVFDMDKGKIKMDIQGVF